MKLSVEQRRGILDRDVDFARTLRVTARDHRSVFGRAVIYTEMLRTQRAERNFARLFTDYQYLFEMARELRFFAVGWRVANTVSACFLNRPIDFRPVLERVEWGLTQATDDPLDQQRLPAWKAVMALYEKPCYEASLREFQIFLKEAIRRPLDDNCFIKLLATLCVHELGEHDRFEIYRQSFRLANRAALKMRFRVRNLSNLLGLEYYWGDVSSFETQREIDSLPCCEAAKVFFKKRAKIYAEACRDFGRAIPFF